MPFYWKKMRRKSMYSKGDNDDIKLRKKMGPNKELILEMKENPTGTLIMSGNLTGIQTNVERKPNRDSNKC